MKSLFFKYTLLSIFLIPSVLSEQLVYTETYSDDNCSASHSLGRAILEVGSCYTSPSFKARSFQITNATTALPDNGADCFFHVWSGPHCNGTETHAIGPLEGLHVQGSKLTGTCIGPNDKGTVAVLPFEAISAKVTC